MEVQSANNHDPVPSMVDTSQIYAVIFDSYGAMQKLDEDSSRARLRA